MTDLIETSDGILYYYRGVCGAIPKEYANSRLIDAYLEDEVFEEACVDCFNRMGLGQDFDYSLLDEKNRYLIEKAQSLLEQLGQFDKYFDDNVICLGALQRPIDELLYYLDALLLPIKVKAWLREEMSFRDKVKSFVKLD